MSKLLFDKQPIIIDRTLAGLVGFNESIVVQQVHYWLEINRSKNQNFFEGRYWTYNSIKAWQENEFPFWSPDTVKRIFKSLEKMGILISGNFNREKWDQTKWYSLNYEKLEELANCSGLKSSNGEGENNQVQEGEMPKPIPENSTEITTENSTIQNPGEGTGEERDVPFEEIQSLFNSMCKSLPEIKGIKVGRRKAVSARWRESPDIEVFKEVFEKVGSSDFLSGKDGKWTGCCFDWIMKPANFQKILEGTYNHRKVRAEKDSDDFDFSKI